MTDLPPHRTLMLLHRMVDHALTPLFDPMGLEHATEGYVTVERADLDALVGAHGDPQSVLAGFGPRAAASGVMVAEPSLSSAVLSRIWRSDRNEGAPLTQVEGEILRQFLARIVSAWAGAWSAEGVHLLPEFSMAGALTMLAPQLPDCRWNIARTVVRERGATAPIGVLLFCYPELLMPQLATEAKGALWRSRISRGLAEDERQRLAARLAGPLRDVAITAPVRIHQDMTLGMLNALERGDIVAFDESAVGDISFSILGREVTGRLAAHGDKLALSLSGPTADGGDATAAGLAPDPAMVGEQPLAEPDFGAAYAEQPPEPAEWDMAI